MKSILVVGAGENQLSLVEKAKELVKKVYVCDTRVERLERLNEVIPIELPTLEIKKFIDVISKLSIDGVVSNESDYTNLLSSYAAESLKLRGTPVSVAKLTTNKIQLRQFLKTTLPRLNPDFIFVESVDKFTERNFTDFAQGSAIVIKPTSNQGSRGVRVLENFQDFRDYSPNEFGDCYILERFINGIEYSVDAIIEKGGVFVTAIARKISYPENICLDRLLFFNFIDDLRIEEKLVAANKSIINKLGLSMGLTHGEYKISSNGDVFLIDFATRGGGAGLSSHVAPFLSGIDIQKELITQSLGERISIQVRNREKWPFAIMKFVDIGFENFDEYCPVLSKDSRVIYSKSFGYIPQEGTKRPDSSNRPGVYAIGADSSAETICGLFEVEALLSKTN